jgi:hypothetical protein
VIKRIRMVKVERRALVEREMRLAMIVGVLGHDSDAEHAFGKRSVLH